MSAVAHPLLRILARDLVLLALTVLAWTQVSHAPAALQLLLGVATLAVAFFAHEWGHWLGGRLAGARMVPSGSVRSLFLFRFDRSNSLRQFALMSAGGYVATVLAVLLFFLVLPAGYLATHTAHLLVAIGLLVTLGVEFPELARVLRSGRFPESFAYCDERERPGAIGPS